MKEKRTEMPGFGTYLLAVLLSPVYYAVEGKWIAAGVTAVLYGVSFFTMPLLGLGILPWVVATAPACWDLRNKIEVAKAKRTGEETAAAMAARMQGN